MEFEKLIKDRFSVRKFKDIPLSEDHINKILDAGNIAPTGCNNQPQRILVLNTSESLEKLKNCTRCHFNAPCAFLVCHNRDESWTRPYDKALSSPVDAVIVATHMMLEAHNIGAGCCWVMHFNPSSMRDAFNIPMNVEPVALLVMGYPDDDAVPLDMHYSRKSLDETVVYDSF